MKSDGTSGNRGETEQRYQEHREIGRGGMARVVEATDILLRRNVAVKEALSTDDETLRRFARETRITARLEHPSIVPVYDAGVDPDGAPFYVMRKIAGRPLEDMVFETESLDVRLGFLPHLVAAAQAVAHAHGRGIIHRDLKPANILVGDLGETIVIDWGLSKVLGETDEVSAPAKTPSLSGSPSGDTLRTRAGWVFGTPGFMAPEQIEARDVDERTDVYALGGCLYYLLGRRPPHAADTGDAMMDLALEGPPVPIERLAPGAPRDLVSICNKALAKDPEQRYAHAGEIADDLRKFLAGQLVASHRYSLREKVVRFVRRHRALVITISAATAALAIGGTLSVIDVISSRNEAVARSTELALSQARLLVENNQPAAAIAVARPFARTHWREVRAIAAGARALGVPWRLPSSAETIALAMSPDGMHAVSCGSDGVIRIHDLARHATREITRVTPRNASDPVRAIYVDDQRLAIWAGPKLWIYDLRERASIAFERPAPIKILVAERAIVYGTDQDRHGAWRFDPSAATFTPIEIDDEINTIAPGHGRVALGGARGLWLIEGERAPERIDDHRISDVSWDAAAPELLAMAPTCSIHVTWKPARHIELIKDGNRFGMLARGRRHTTGIERRINLEPLTTAKSIDLGTAMLGLAVTHRDLVVHATARSLVIADELLVHELPLPETPDAFAASPQSPYLVAAARDLLLVWKVDEFMPRRIPVPPYFAFDSLGAHDVITVSSGVAGAREPAVWTDIATATTTVLSPRGVFGFAATPSGALAISLHSPGDKMNRTQLFWRGGSETLPFTAHNARFLDEQRIVYVSPQGQIGRYDRASRHHRSLRTITGDIKTSKISNAWIAIATRDGRLVRVEVATQRMTETPLAPDHQWTDPDADGRIWIAANRQLRLWHSNGTLEDLHLPEKLLAPVHAFFSISGGRALVACNDGTTYLIALTDPSLRMERTVSLSSAPDTSWDHSMPAGLLVITDTHPGLEIVDLEANVSWRIARSLLPSSIGGLDRDPHLMSDGFAVVTRGRGDLQVDKEDVHAKQPTALVVWPLALPNSPEETARWIDGLTNADYDPRSRKLSWH